MALTTRSAIKGYIATTEAACGSGVQIEAALIECPPMYGQGEDVRMRRFWQELCDALNTKANEMHGTIMCTIKAIPLEVVEGGIEFVGKDERSWKEANCWVMEGGTQYVRNDEHPTKCDRAQIRGGQCIFKMGLGGIYTFTAKENCPKVAMMLLVHILTISGKGYVTVTKGLPDCDDIAWEKIFHSL
jgi:hypothetical protein